MELGIRTPAEYIVKGKYHDPEASAEATKQLLSLPDPPTCIIYPDDYSYLGGLRVFEKRGLTVPDDISVVGSTVSTLSRICGRGLPPIARMPRRSENRL